MAFRLDRDRSVAAGLASVIRKQVDGAVEDVANRQLSHLKRIHKARTRCKKIRAAFRLVRPCDEDIYQKENAWFRDAAHDLSILRDADAIVVSFDNLFKNKDSSMLPDEFKRVRRQLLKIRREQIPDAAGIERRLADFVTKMRRARKRCHQWLVEACDPDTLACGLAETYRGARNAFQESRETPDDAVLHEWRKRVKYHRYQLRLLRDAWPPVMKKLSDQASKLSDLLGDDHDLIVLRDQLMNLKNVDASAVAALCTLIAARQHELRAGAIPLGAHIFAEKPSAFARRFAKWWKSAESAAAA